MKTSSGLCPSFLQFQGIEKVMTIISNISKAQGLRTFSDCLSPHSCTIFTSVLNPIAEFARKPSISVPAYLHQPKVTPFFSPQLSHDAARIFFPTIISCKRSQGIISRKPPSKFDVKAWRRLKHFEMKWFNMISKALFCGVFIQTCALLWWHNYFSVLRNDATCLKTKRFCVKYVPALHPPSQPQPTHLPLFTPSTQPHSASTHIYIKHKFVKNTNMSI